MHKFDLKNRTAIVTGGAQGFGYAIVKRFIDSGANVIIWDIDKKFIVDDFVDAGWKKSKEFITDAKNENGDLLTPEAKEIWYGFFKRKDIEIRFYENHSMSSTFGKESAEKAISRAVNANAGGGIITSTNNRVSYQSYVVSGNTVILCQDLLPDCILLSEKLE